MAIGVHKVRLRAVVTRDLEAKIKRAARRSGYSPSQRMTLLLAAALEFEEVMKDCPETIHDHTKKGPASDSARRRRQSHCSGRQTIDVGPDRGGEPLTEMDRRAT
jgi:hypothetical protein